jgi:hypothetical protein
VPAHMLEYSITHPVVRFDPNYWVELLFGIRLAVLAARFLTVSRPTQTRRSQICDEGGSPLQFAKLMEDVVGKGLNDNARQNGDSIVPRLSPFGPRF